MIVREPFRRLIGSNSLRKRCTISAFVGQVLQLADDTVEALRCQGYHDGKVACTVWSAIG